MKREYAYLIIAIVLFLGATQYAIHDARDPWFDVAFSLQTAHVLQENPSAIVWTEFDVHPPVYYITLAGWQSIRPQSVSEYVWGQELSVVFGAFFLIFVFAGLWRLFGRTGAIAIIPFSLLSTYVHYATEVRMYAMLLMFSGLMFWAAVNEFRKRIHLYSGFVAAMILPFIHYFGAIVVPVMMLLYFAVAKKRSTDIMIWIFSGYFASLIIAFILAMQQMLRTSGSWFQVSSISSYPSALFYAFFTVENSVMPQWLAITVYAVFLLGCFALVIWMMKRMQANNITRKEKALIVMMTTAIIPLAALAINPFLNIYHHRLFIAVTWMFAAASLVVVVQAIRNQANILRKLIASSAIACVILLMVFVGVAGSHTELRQLSEGVPCEEVMVVHESGFSALPFEVFSRERSCGWDNVIVTNISRRASHSAGFDVVENESIYWNLSVPEQSFYYVQAANTVPVNHRIVNITAQVQGARVVYVHEATIVEVQLQ